MLFAFSISGQVATEIGALSDGDAQIQFESNNGGQLFTVQMDNDGDLRFVANGNLLGNEAMRITDNNGRRVAIGTSVPVTKLHVAFTGTDGILIDGNDSGDARLSLENGLGTHYLFDDDSDAHALDLESANDLAFNTGGANERMRIDNIGRSAINRNIAGLTQLYVESDQSWCFISNNNNSGATTQYATFGDCNGSGTGTRYGVYGDARVSSGNRYAVYGTAITTGTNSWATYGNGDFYYTGSFQAPSDARLKKDISNMSTVLSKVMLLRPKTYEFDHSLHPYINLAQGPQFGFLSQDLEEVFPELVEDNTHKFQFGGTPGVDSGEEVSVDIKSVDYIKMIPILTKAIQEQQEIIEDLRSRLDELEGK